MAYIQYDIGYMRRSSKTVLVVEFYQQFSPAEFGPNPHVMHLMQLTKV